MNEIDTKKGDDGETYYRCKKCGAVGNWKERLESGKCHISNSPVGAENSISSKVIDVS